jgi:hypothetical protein
MVEVSQKIYPAGQKREIRYTKRALLFMLTFAVKINAERERERELTAPLIAKMGQQPMHFELHFFAKH